jgi:uncharacterized LabA/DUF88 family protein
MRKKETSRKQKVIVFIDGSNIYFAQKKMGKWLDWVKVKRFLEGKYHVLEYRYYVGLRSHDRKMKKFLRKLKKIGFSLMTKPIKTVIDEKGNIFEKANFDVEMATDALRKVDQVDVVIFFSGDSDFAYLCRLICRQNKKIYFFSSKKTLAWELRENANGFYYLENLQHLTKQRRFIRL